MCSDHCLKALKSQAEYQELCRHLWRNYPIIWGLLTVELPFLEEEKDVRGKTPKPDPTET